MLSTWERGALAAAAAQPAAPLAAGGAGAQPRTMENGALATPGSVQGGEDTCTLPAYAMMVHGHCRPFLLCLLLLGMPVGHLA